ncbi:MAG: ATPase, T2SS/T4P/T4SS family [Vicinamibacterales bacterium]
MPLVDSLLTAVVRSDGDALVLHVGEKPYVVAAGGTVDLSRQGLGLGAMEGMLAQLLSPDALRTLREMGAVEYELEARPAAAGDRFTIVAARGGDDIWIEMRRHRRIAAAESAETFMPIVDEAFVAAAATPSEVEVAAAAASESERAAQPDEAEAADAPADEGGPTPVLLSTRPVAAEAWDATPSPAPEEDILEPAPVVLPPLTSAPAFSLDEDAATAAPEEDAFAPAAVVLSPRSFHAASAPEDEVYTLTTDDDAVFGPAPVLLASPGASAEGEAMADATDRWSIDVDESEGMAPPAEEPAAIVGMEADAAEASDEPEAVVPHADAPLEPVPAAAADDEPLVPADAVPEPITEMPAVAQVEIPAHALAWDPPAADVHLGSVEVAPPVSDPATPLPAADAAAPAHAAVAVEAGTHSAPAASQAVEDAEPAAAAPTAPPAAPVSHVAAATSPAPSEAPVREPAAAPAFPSMPPTAARVGPPQAPAWSDALAASRAPEPPPMEREPAPRAPEVADPLPAVVLSLTRDGLRNNGSTTRGPVRLGGIERLLRVAAARGASALYLTTQARPAVRVDGDIRLLESEPPLSSGDVEAAVLELAPEGARDKESAEWIRDLHDIGRVRITTFRDYRGPGALLRMIQAKATSAEQLGLVREIQALATEPEGLVIVTGPRASGKSTLVSAFVDLINRQRSDHVITLEGQIRFVHESRGSLVSQRELRGSAAEVVTAARAALRENPDVLVIEDLRSPDVLQVALDAAGSGLLVFVSMTAASATAALERLVDLCPSEQRRTVRAALAEHLRGVVAQVLLRKTGGGRLAARELVLNTSAVAALVGDGQIGQLPRAIDGGRKVGMAPLNDALVAFVQSGAVDVREAYRKADDKAGFLALLRREGIDTSFVERLA